MPEYPEHEDLGLDLAADRKPDLRPRKDEAAETAISTASEPTLTRK